MATAIGLSLTRVSAVDGKLTPEAEREAIDDAAFRRNTGCLMLPASMAVQAPYQGASRIPGMTDDIALFIEDDVELSANLKDRVQAAFDAGPDADVLTVALNLGRTNIEVVFEALRQMQSDGKPVPQFVIASSQRKRLHRYASWPLFRVVQDKLIFINNPNQTDLAKLYKGALGVVMPSKLEGSGGCRLAKRSGAALQ